VPFQSYPGVVVGGGNDTTGALRARPLRGRPHWWAVLAVALSLMALLAATSSPGPGVTGSGHHGVALDLPAQQTTSRPAQSASSTTTTLAAIAHDLRSVSGAGANALGPTAVVSALKPSTGTTTTTTAVTTTTTGTGVGSGPSPQNRTQQGYLQPPDNTSAMYAFTADGPTRVSASWATADTLLLSVTCPSGTTNEEGSSSVTITTAANAGSCQATLSEPASDSSTVSYTITIEPAP
jgi:hypothetical protein